MQDIVTCVEEFHNAFGVENGKFPDIPEGYELRFNLMEEENNEYFEACKNKDLVGVADALGDMLYILVGTMLVHGMTEKMDNVFNEIHISNMSKLGEDGKPIYRKDGKVLKGPHYFKPDIAKFFKDDQ